MFELQEFFFFFPDLTLLCGAFGAQIFLSFVSYLYIYRSLTSSAVDVATVNLKRAATEKEVNEARWRLLRKLKKKALVQLQLTHGVINLEIHADACPCTSENFITLCKRGYYDGCTIHRSIKNFMMQTGDPTGTGKGGESCWGGPFGDECDAQRLRHSGRGVVSMANSGPNTNKSQFFILYKSAPHLDGKHTVFGMLVGGGATLDVIEGIETDSNDRPVEEVKIISTQVFQDPFDQADDQLEQAILKKIAEREERLTKKSVHGVFLEKGTAITESTRKPLNMVGKYITARPPIEGSAPPTAATAAVGGDGMEDQSQPSRAKKPKGGGGFGSFSTW